MSRSKSDIAPFWLEPIPENVSDGSTCWVSMCIGGQATSTLAIVSIAHTVGPRRITGVGSNGRCSDTTALICRTLMCRDSLVSEGSGVGDE
jgi:hypothetical protein